MYHSSVIFTGDWGKLACCTVYHRWYSYANIVSIHRYHLYQVRLTVLHNNADHCQDIHILSDSNNCETGKLFAEQESNQSTGNPRMHVFFHYSNCDQFSDFEFPINYLIKPVKLNHVFFCFKFS